MDNNNPLPNDNGISWQWNFGDPNSGTSNIVSGNRANLITTGFNMSHTYSTPGTYNANLVIVFNNTSVYCDVDINGTFYPFATINGVPTITIPFAVTINPFTDNNLIISGAFGCQGTTSTYSIPPIAGNTYQWQLLSNGNFVNVGTNSSNYVFDNNVPAGPHIIQVVMTTPSGCPISSPPRTIIVKQTPVVSISRDAVACQGVTTGLTATVAPETIIGNGSLNCTNNYNYLWSTNATTAHIGNITPAPNSAYSVTVTCPASGCSGVASTALGQCADSIFLVVIWEPGVNIAQTLADLRGIELDHTMPSNARLIRIPGCNIGQLNGVPFSYWCRQEAVGVMDGPTSSVSDNFVITYPSYVPINPSTGAQPLPTEMFDCGGESAKIGAEVTFERNHTASGAKVGIFDTGIALSNLQLAPKVSISRNCLLNLNGSTEPNNINDLSGHGTAVAGIIDRSMNPADRFYIYKVLDSRGIGTVYELIRAIDYAIYDSVHIMSMSITGIQQTDDIASSVSPLRIALGNAATAGILAVAAAGNNSLDLFTSTYKTVPIQAGVENILGVGSIDCNGNKSSFSNFRGKPGVDIMTYGENIRTWNQFGQVVTVSGTSFSTAVASALVKKLYNYSAVALANRDWRLIKTTIITSALRTQALQDLSTSDGMLNAPRAACLLLQDCGIIPIELLYFKVKAKGNSALVTWQTSQEYNMAHFEIEHSIDGTHFQPIGTVKAKNMPANYTFTDLNPQQGVNYYRLKSVDIDGAFKYAPIVSVEIATKNDQIRVYPNPCSDYCTVEIPNNIQQRAIELVNSLGKTVWQLTVPASGSNTTHFSIPVAQLPSGIYWLKQNGLTTQKIIKM
jgi:hypothetical protein